MHQPTEHSRLWPTLIGTVAGGGAGVFAAFLLTGWSVQGMGAAQGFADDPNVVPGILAFFSFFGVLIGGSGGGIAGYRISGARPVADKKDLAPFDELA